MQWIKLREDGNVLTPSGQAEKNASDQAVAQAIGELQKTKPGKTPQDLAKDPDILKRAAEIAQGDPQMKKNFNAASAADSATSAMQTPQMMRKR